jgi:hypothetical protein
VTALSFGILKLATGGAVRRLPDSDDSVICYRTADDDHQPYFYSDLFDLVYEAVGEPDSSLEIVEDWKELFRKGIINNFRDGRVCGVLL